MVGPKHIMRREDVGCETSAWDGLFYLWRSWPASQDEILGAGIRQKPQI
jgi:hypothetical protein